jgi:CHAT domain-containing protein
MASVIHLGCHAALDPGTNPLRSALQLADGPLAVERILRHAAARPQDAVAGLVVLGACTSDATAAAFDESLTLTTSMLAAGAYGVVGARWRVRDARTAVLLYALHHHLAAGSRPADALRAVQRWARDPDRKPLPRMPENLVETLDRLDHDPGEPDFAHVYSWAAFAHHGC